MTKRDEKLLTLAIVDLILVLRHVVPLLEGEAKREAEEFLASAKNTIALVGKE